MGGIATMMHIPRIENAEKIDVSFVGVPRKIGTSNRSETRFGLRQIRSESVLLGPYDMATGAVPFDSSRVADIGDVTTNPYSLVDSVGRIESACDEIVKHNCRPIPLGGTKDEMSGEKIFHGTPFRRAVEDGPLDGNRVTQIGLRGTDCTGEDFSWCRKQGFTVIQAKQCWYRSSPPHPGRRARERYSSLSELRY